MRTVTLFNYDWEFVKLCPGSDPGMACASEEWKRVTLPHDWLIYDTSDLYGDADGWYRKSFALKKDTGSRYLINFDGVYMDCTVYVNDIRIGDHRYGYSAFEFDITEALVSGDNTVMVAVRHKSPNSRWYSGAGIFRDVTFKEVPLTYIATDGVYITTERETGKRWRVTADTELAGVPDIGSGSDDRMLPEGWEIRHDIRLLPSDPADVGTIARPCADAEGFIPDDSSNGDNCSICRHPCARRKEVHVSGVENNGTTTTFYVDNVFAWDVISPNRYELTTSLVIDGKTVDTVYDIFGFRTIEFTPDRGFFLNGRHVKLNGVCEHHDLGCLGAAFNKAAMRRKLLILKDMGVNAVRTSHNMPARGLMELADEMGILIDSEAFDMWRHPKTEFDYARFFDECHTADIASWVRRDRNHPSVIIWSVGNEIYDCHGDPSAAELITELRDSVRQHDPRCNAPVTMGSNYMPWEGAQKCTDRLKLAGYNYGETLYEAHHAKYPDWMIYGSETSSTVQSRGVYHFPLRVSVMADDDEQCSTLGNCSTSWGAPDPEYVIAMDRDAGFSAGTFIWSGFDYIGEPTPYHTRNSYFGQVDTAGFPKDTYYIYKAEWTDPQKAPFVHLFPYWDFNEGQLIDVRAASNAAAVELIVNGVSSGRKSIDHLHGRDELVPTWQVPYHRGYIEAVAYDMEGNVTASDRRESFGDSYRIGMKVFTAPSYDEAVREQAVHKDIVANGTDLVFIEVFTTDIDGHRVENATDRINISVSGSGRLAGLDNGDSTDTDRYKASSKKLFAGSMLAVVAAAERPGTITVNASAAGLIGCELTLEAVADELRREDHELVSDCIYNEIYNDIPVRKIELKADRTVLDAEHRTAHVSALILPEGSSDDELEWRAVNDSAVISNLAVVEADGADATVTALGDGEFRLRCMSKSGTDVFRTISVLEFRAEGIGQAYLDPYGFIAGSLYTDSRGDIGNGNEKGVATARTGDSYVGFENIDFGSFGSDEITIPIFTLNSDEYRIGIWEGRPGAEGSTLLLDAVYQKTSIWNVYQPETYKLTRRVRGISSIYFTSEAKFHIKGFSFARQNRAACLIEAAECDSIAGDSYVKGEHDVTGIGNNVALEFDDMDFMDKVPSILTICGRSDRKNSIHLKVTDDSGEVRTTLLEFVGTGDYEEQSFAIEGIAGRCRIAFVFLPGSSFDLRYFRFY